MDVPGDRFYSDYHVWVLPDSDSVMLGLSHYAIEQLGTVDFIELPELGAQILRDSAFALVETSKAVTELVAPVSGTVTSVNASLQDHPELLEEDPYGAGWIVTLRLSDIDELKSLMSASHYGMLLAPGA